MLALGIDFGGTKILIGIINQDGEIIKSIKRIVPRRKKIDDIIEELEVALRPILKTVAQKPAPTLTMFEQTIFDVLAFEPLHIDLISEQSRLSPSDTLVNLLSLEFKGLIRQMAGKMFVKI